MVQALDDYYDQCYDEFKALNNETDLAFRAERDLQSFKDYIEARVQQISGWQSGVSEEAPPLAG